MNEEDEVFEMGGEKYKIKKWNTVYSAEVIKKCLCCDPSYYASKAVVTVVEVPDENGDIISSSSKLPLGENVVTYDSFHFTIGLADVLIKASTLANDSICQFSQQLRELSWKREASVIVKRLPREFRSWKLASRLQLLQGCFDRSVSAIHRFYHQGEEV